MSDMINLDELLDITLDDIEDLPSFDLFPIGTHHCLCSFDTKEANGKQAIEFSIKLVETIELANPEDQAPKAGDTNSTLFFLENEFGLGAFKRIAKVFAEALNLTSIRDVIEGVKDVEAAITTSKRLDKKTKKDTGEIKYYLDIKEVKVL